MEIAENITWTEELERLDALLSQGQFELLLPGERYGGGEKEIWLVYLMNDAAESFLVFHDAELTGTYQKEYEGEIDAALEKDGEQYVLIVRQKETVCTLFFSRLSLEVHLFDYGKTGHFWVDGYEYLRQIEFRIAILRDKLEYLGEAFCTEEEMRLKRNLPGPFTFILNTGNRLPKIFKNRKEVGIRVPDNNIIREICHILKAPIMTTTLPLKDGEDIEYITTPELIEEKFGKEVELIIDGGIGNIEPSTIVNCTSGEAEIVRQGKGILNDF